MKKIIISCLLAVLFLSTASAQYGAQRTGYEGDYFSLEGAIDVFKHSYSIDDFERRLNREDTWVNNLDLNYDGRIDYIRVEHRRQGDFHAIILQVPIDRYEVQDVAVIEIERTGRREAILQIVGDEDLYGEEVIVEPINDRGYSNGYVNVYNWRPVRYIFGRNYRVYDSPYSWGYYPTWWSPWNQCAWNVFRPRIVVYHTHYHVVHVHRVVHVHNFYKPHRAYSHHVVQHTNQVRVKHGKAPVHREKAQRVNQRDDRQVDNPKVETPRTRPSRNSGANPQSTPADKPRSRNDVVQKPEQRPRTQQTESKRDVQQSTPPKRRNSTPKANTQQREKPSSQNRGGNTSRDQVKKSNSSGNKATQRNTSRGNTSRNEARKSNTSQSKATQGNTSRSNTSQSRNSNKSQKPSASAKKSTPASGNKASGNSRTKTSRNQ